ncbi:MAG: thiamine pyrophosphate-binding protein, partial [Ruthenibacterium sp.]
SIRQTQHNIFAEHCTVGIGPESHDLGFPILEKLAEAYGYPYFAARANGELQQMLDGVFAAQGAAIGEVFVSAEQVFEPKAASKRLPDGTMVSPPLEDLAPFLSREELARNMLIPLLPEE